MMYQQQQQRVVVEREEEVDFVAKDIDVHNAIEAVQNLHEAYRKKLKQARTDCDEIQLYNRYVQDLSEVLDETIAEFHSHEKLLRISYDNRVRSPMEEISPDKIAQIGGPANTSFDTCCNGKNSDETATLGLKEEQQERQSVKSYQEKVSQTEGVVDDNNRQNQSMISEIQNGEASTATIKNKNDSSGSSSRSSKKIKGIKLNRINREFLSDTQALICEVSDKHDQILRLRDRLRMNDEEISKLTAMSKLREKVIKDLRTVNKKLKAQSNSSSPALLTPPRTPELKSNSNDSCGNSSDVETTYKSSNNFLTVPGQQNPMSASGDSCFSLYELDQESKASSEVNFQLCCFDDANNRDELERLNHMIVEMESENGCNRLLITRLEDELLAIRKSEMRTKHDRDLKSDKLRILRYKVKTACSKMLDKSTDDFHAPILNLNDLATIEDDLKPEYDLINSLIKSFGTIKKHSVEMDDENRELVKTMEKLKIDLSDAMEKNRLLEQQISSSQPAEYNSVVDRKTVEDEIFVNIANLSRMLGKEIQPESIGELSSSPESAGSSLSQTNSLTEVINDWRRELEEKNCLLREKNSLIQSLEEQLKHRHEEIVDIREQHQSIELDRDKNCQMVNQLKSAIQIHNESIQFLKRHNAELRADLDESKEKFEKYHDHFNDVKKRNNELDDENQNLHKTIDNLRSTIEEMKSNHSIQHSNDIDDLNSNINLLNKQLYQENVRKEDQMNLLRDANLQLRSQVFDLNQDVSDLLEIVENLKNRRMLEDYKIAQKEQERQIEKEIIKKEKDLCNLKHFRVRCVEIESEYLDKMSSQKYKYDATIRDLETEITALTEQLIKSHQLNTEHDELMQQTAILQNSMTELENQNDLMKRTIESYQTKFGELQVTVDRAHFENEALTIEISQLKSDIVDKSKKICELTVDQQRATAELDMQKKSCKCSPNSSPQRRLTSTVVQMNDLKTKLMNMSLENSKANEALKRKSLQYEKLQRQSNEEKSRLREECLKSIQMVGELKSKITMLEMKSQEQSDEVIISREKCSQAIARMTAIETELSSRTAKLEDLEEREQKWRTQAYEITHEIKSRKDEAFKREEKLILELNSKTDATKDQARMIMQCETSIQYLQSENQTLKNANSSMNQRIIELKFEHDEQKRKEAELTDLLEKTDQELKSIKSEVCKLLNTDAGDDLKTAAMNFSHTQDDLSSKYQNVLKEYNSLQEENKTLKELRNDTIDAIELFKRLQSESSDREKSYRLQIAKLQSDKRNLHKDRTHLTKQLLSKHRDMIILNSEIEKFRDYDDYESRSNSHHNSLQPFQSVMYPSALAPLVKTNSNPDLMADPISFDLRGMSEKMARTRNFWSHGLKSAVGGLTKTPPPEAVQQNFENLMNPDPSTYQQFNAPHQPFILNPNLSSTATPPQSLHPQFFLTPPSTSSQMFIQNFPISSSPPVQPQHPESLTMNDSLEQYSITESEATVIAADQSMQDQIEISRVFPGTETNQSPFDGNFEKENSPAIIDVKIENVDDDENSTENTN